MSDDGSLFENSMEELEEHQNSRTLPSCRVNSIVSGLHCHPEMKISQDIAQSLLEDIEKANYFANGANQVMLFGRTVISSTGTVSTGLPHFIGQLILQLESICRPHLPPHVHDMLFPSDPNVSKSRQVIFNRYVPGEGISAHVDLLQRYDDGIIGVSLGSGCAMDFKAVDPPDLEMSLWLPVNSVIVLEGDARYKWTHGIKGLHGDVIRDETTDNVQWVPRETRTSITLRWLLAGADIVGFEAQS
ncbi:hypothetical protein M408DRAFT_177752 [Serendipita vermifera MAFF 305830]|uniref:Fe2OG dioxygenase domain-containing protein n=1 Tax=Serendipita vermifera MAFF 305830 TaxID=933852 RepID=A0A0C3B3M1_SERVB|nr:hypothetical protein M408DRAFT_177752 [Serendipita vermifera MAFF 305830]